MELAQLLDLSVKQNASDLHLSPQQPPLFRIHGDLVSLNGMPCLDEYTIKILIYSVLSLEQQRKLESDRELDFSFMQSNGSNFRGHAFYQTKGLAAVFRVIPEKIPTLEELHIPSVIKSILDSSQGLILVTGPTGSGKSTTLASMVDYINMHQGCHIITIEDPVEFQHASKKSLISQRQVCRDTLDFSAALRAALREDPDVILIGEMRDLESIRLALTAAETGHLILATLHTSSASRAVSRIVDVFPTGEKNIIRNMLSESLQAVICQRLIKNLSGGRSAAFEIMLATPAIRNLIREDKISQIYSSIQTGSGLGMCTLDQYLGELMKKKMIDRLVAHEIALNKEMFK